MGEDCGPLLVCFGACLAPVIQRIDAPALLTVSLQTPDPESEHEDKSWFQRGSGSENQC